ncbi:HAMP domain-containing histidine kinase [Halosimplex rubrum]|uniref:histidine kinase n=1 Tax=Halosimplex rubrum TaxID=869889 RepID=A0A7D5P3B1_9EURY|nr:HAMP domain-containing sensor histidine kinase [Halosimplex rubrum]QLH77104.1 HAMP domain-containing histidine kinase [Halosimplex rubrum]
MTGDASAEAGGFPRQVVGSAALLTVTMVAEAIARASGWGQWTGGGALVFTGEFLVGVVTTIPFLVGIGYVGYRLPEGDLDPERYPRVRRWFVGSAVASAVFNLVLIAVIGTTSVGMFVAWVRWSAAVGAGIGLAVGLSEAKAIQRSVDAARAEFRAEHAASQRDFLDYLNGLLRHEILNATQVISGNAEVLRNDHDPGTAAHDRGTTIYRQSQDVTEVIQNVRELLHATWTEKPLESVDAASVLRAQIETADSRYDEATFEADVPERALVEANPLLGRVFGNLLANAVEHSDGPVSVSVTMAVADDEVSVRVADDGPGVPQGEVSDLFDRPDTLAVDHGIGLYLSAKLVEQYRGTIDLAENGGDGAVFRVRLPRATDDTAVDPAEPRDPDITPATPLGSVDRSGSPTAPSDGHRRTD